MKHFLTLLCSLCFLFVTAQDSFQESLRQQLIRDWERAKLYTNEYLDAMPADKYGFRPTDSVRNFAEQMLHFAQSNAGMAFIATGISHPSVSLYMRPDFGKSMTAQTKDSVVYYMNTSYDIMIAAVRNMNMSTLNEMISRQMPGGMRTATRLGWILKSFEHQNHHRGQCTIYLRLSGIKPPPERIWD